MKQAYLYSQRINRPHFLTPMPEEIFPVCLLGYKRKWPIETQKWSSRNTIEPLKLFILLPFWKYAETYRLFLKLCIKYIVDVCLIMNQATLLDAVNAATKYKDYIFWSLQLCRLSRQRVGNPAVDFGLAYAKIPR